MIPYRLVKWNKDGTSKTVNTEITLTAFVNDVNASENVYIDCEDYLDDDTRVHISSSPFSFHVDLGLIDLIVCNCLENGARMYYIYQKTADFTLRFDCYYLKDKAVSEEQTL